MQQKIATLSTSADEIACNSVFFVQGDVAHCQSTVQERYQQLAGQGDVQIGPSAQSGLPLESVGLDSGS